MTYTEWIIGSVFFGCFAIPFVIIGAGILFYPRKAIDNAVSMAKRFPSYDPSQYPDPYGKWSIFHYRLMGIFLIIFGACPFAAIFLSGP